MAMQLKTFNQLVADSLAYVLANSKLTDIAKASVIRAVIEAFCLNDAEIYIKLAGLLDYFNLDRVFGDDLADRAAEYGVEWPKAKPALAALQFSDSRVTSVVASTLGAPIVAGALSAIQVQNADFASFPSSGQVVIDRQDSGTREVILYASKTAPNLLNCPAATAALNAHTTGASVYFSWVGVDLPVPSGTTVYSQATPGNKQINFITLAGTTIKDGDKYAPTVQAQSTTVGAATKVGANTIKFFNNKPWLTAVVNNPSAAFQGQDKASEEQVRQLIRTKIQTASRATSLSITDAVLTADYSGEKVITTQLVEPLSVYDVNGYFVPNQLFIHDGSPNTGFVTTVDPGAGVAEMIVNYGVSGQRRCRMALWPIVPGSLDGAINKSTDRGIGVAGVNTLQDNSKAWTPNQWATNAVVDANGKVAGIISNTSTTLTLDTTLTSGSYGIFAEAPLTRGTDYQVNESTGEIELSPAKALVAGDKLVAVRPMTPEVPVYSAYSGLIGFIQKVVNGDPSDYTTFPGVKAAGVQMQVLPPTIDLLDIYVQVTPAPGAAETVDLDNAVAAAVSQYVQSLKIGDAFILSEAIRYAKEVSGAYDVQFFNPPQNVGVLPGHILRINTIQSV